MAYTMLKNQIKPIAYEGNTLEGAALLFIREYCEELRFDKSKATDIAADKPDKEGKSLKANQIPFNMEKDIDRLCLENAIAAFLKTGRKEDAFNIYFCYLEMFVGNYEKTGRMIELLSEFEANGSSLLMKHRDHYSHSAYVFVLGLAIYASNELYRKVYKAYYKLQNEQEAACHYLQYWGLSALFHDIGYPFELPFEQVASYFETAGDKDKVTVGERRNGPFSAYRALDKFTVISDKVSEKLHTIIGDKKFSSTNELFAFMLADKLGETYGFTEEQMLSCLIEKPTHPDKFNYFMDHAYFSANILFKKLFEEMECELSQTYLDALTAILMHNSLYKFSIAHYKDAGNKPFAMQLHPLAYMLMLCDELQCWDRTAYGRNSKKQLHPMGCSFDFSDNQIKAVYLYDEKEIAKVNRFKDAYIDWLQDSKGDRPQLKAYGEMYICQNGKSEFLQDIEAIVDLSELKLQAAIGLAEHVHSGNRSYLSDSSFINLYDFAIVLNGRWNSTEWELAKKAGREEQFLTDEAVKKRYADDFKQLSLEYKLSNINQAKAFAKYLNAIDCFYTDKDVDFEFVEKFTEKELVKIGKLEHQRWLQEHYDMGWVYGTPEKGKRDLLRQHIDMIPEHRGFEVLAEEAEINYSRLDKTEQDKDTKPMECMLAMLKLFDGLRIYRLN